MNEKNKIILKMICHIASIITSLVSIVFLIWFLFIKE